MLESAGEVFLTGERSPPESGNFGRVIHGYLYLVNIYQCSRLGKPLIRIQLGHDFVRNIEVGRHVLNVVVVVEPLHQPEDLLGRIDIQVDRLLGNQAQFADLRLDSFGGESLGNRPEL